MTFNSFAFAKFFVVVYLGYLLSQRNFKLQNFLLLVASYFFYAWWNPIYLILLFGSSAIDYLMVLLMERKEKTRKLWLIISLVSNFGFLAFFKYAYFLTDNLNVLLGWLHVPLALPDPVSYPNGLLGLFGVPPSKFFSQIVLPIGISFHTFQSMSYTIDAYYRRVQIERSFMRFLTFVSFFPQLVAGPIERSVDLLPQIATPPPSERRADRRRCLPAAVGLFQEGGDSRQCGGHCQRRVQRLRPARRCRHVDRNLGVRHPDLRRLLGLLGHRARAGPSHGVPSPGEF